MLQTFRVSTLNREDHGAYKDKILSWCSKQEIDIFYIARELSDGPKHYIWGITCSEEKLLLFMIAWGANVEGKIKGK